MHSTKKSYRQSRAAAGACFPPCILPLAAHVLTYCSNLLVLRLKVQLLLERGCAWTLHVECPLSLELSCCGWLCTFSELLGLFYCLFSAALLDVFSVHTVFLHQFNSLLWFLSICIPEASWCKSVYHCKLNYHTQLLKHHILSQV